MSTQAELLTSKAFLDLDTNVALGRLAPPDAAVLKARYADVSAGRLALAEAERDAMDRYTRVAGQLQVESAALDAATARTAELLAAGAAAEEERAQAAHALAELEARDAALNAELQELRSQEALLGSELETQQAENEARVGPVLRGLSDEAAAAQREAAACLAAAEVSAANTAQLKSRVEHLRKAIAVHRAALAKAQEELRRVSGEPAKVAQQADSVARVAAQVAAETARTKAALTAREEDAAKQAAVMGEVRGVRAQLDAQLASHRAELDAREAEVSGLEHLLRKERAQGKELAERRVELQAERERAAAGVTAARTQLDTATNAYERGKRELKRRLEHLNDVTAGLGPAEAAVAGKEAELAALQRDAAAQQAELESVRREMDVLVAQYLREEAAEKKQRDAVAEAVARCAALNQEQAQWAAEEATAHKQLAALKSQRDMKQREVARMAAAKREAGEQLAMKQLLLADLTTQVAASAGRAAQFARLYEAAKVERNALAKAAATCKQGAAELRERSKLLASEVEVLGNETAAKDRALDRERHAHAASCARRDQLRGDINKQLLAQRERQEAVEGRMLEVDRLAASITALQRDMGRLRREHAAAVESRNAVGIRVIDANEEFCLLCERSNAQERAQGAGEAALRQVGEEVRGLRLAADELARQCSVAQRALPEGPALVARLEQLRATVAAAQERAEQLGEELEAPPAPASGAVSAHAATLSTRAVTRLGGDDPEAAELAARVELLEERVGAAREALLQQQVALEEAKAARAAALAEAEGASSGGGEGPETASALAAAKQVNELGAKVREATKRLMAAVAELSLHQATEMKLAADVEAAHKAKAAAEEAAVVEQPPTAAAEMRLAATQRATAQLAAMHAAAAAAAEAGPDAAAARPPPRPNAYIPEGPGLGLPKPFPGAFQPFAPSK